MATIGVVVVGAVVLGMLFALIKRIRNEEKALKTTDSQTKDKGPCRPSCINYGIRDGECVICSNCKHNNRVGVGFDQPQFQCDGCGEIIVLRGTDKEKRHGEILETEFNRYDMKDSR